MEGCQMEYFQTKNPNLSKFWRFLQWKDVGNCLAIWYILRPFSLFFGHLVYFMCVVCTKKNLAALMATLIDGLVRLTSLKGPGRVA
jgi:hypothetical protein